MAEHFRRKHKEHCRICYKHFKNKNHLTEHVVNVHESKKRKPYLSCMLCNSEYMAAWKGSFRKHFAKNHKDSECCKAKSSNEIICHILEEHINFHCWFCEDILQKVYIIGCLKSIVMIAACQAFLGCFAKL